MRKRRKTHVIGKLKASPLRSESKTHKDKLVIINLKCLCTYERIRIHEHSQTCRKTPRTLILLSVHRLS